jgi:hypothetical protein
VIFFSLIAESKHEAILYFFRTVIYDRQTGEMNPKLESYLRTSADKVFECTRNLEDAFSNLEELLAIYAD